MVNLIIDIGNSSAKVALTHDCQIVERYCFHENIIKNIERLITPQINGAIVCSTRKPDEELEKTLQTRIPNTIILNHKTPTPLKNLYATPETLGMDRLAAAVGAWSISPNNDLLIIDMGTAITIDSVNNKGEYVGGNISPGMAMRFNALNHFTQKLPLVTYNQESLETLMFGQTTHQAILAGVMRGIEYEIKGYINENPARKIFFTGRDANNFVKSLKNTIFADYELVIKGLDRILEYNAK